MGQDSVTRWIEEVKRGDSIAQEQLWKRYFHRLVALARVKLEGSPRESEDEEDVALNSFNSFFSRAREGEFPLLSDRTNLWPLLAKITVRKAINQREKMLAKKRGHGKVRGESVLSRPGPKEAQNLDFVLDMEPTPEFAVEMAEQCRKLLDALPRELRDIAERKLQGWSNSDIAAELGRVPRTVDRKVERIRCLWSIHMEDR